MKAREEIACKKLHGKAASVDQCEVRVDDWQKHRLPELLKRFKAEEIFNTDETGLFCKCLPNKSHVMKNEKCVGGKLSKERITVLLTVSMAGEKLPPLVIRNQLIQDASKTSKNCHYPMNITPKLE